MFEVFAFSYIAMIVISFGLMAGNVISDPSAMSVSIDGVEDTKAGRALGFFLLLLMSIVWPLTMAYAEYQGDSE